MLKNEEVVNLAVTVDIRVYLALSIMLVLDITL